MSCVFIASFLKIELSCKYHAYGKDQMPRFFHSLQGTAICSLQHASSANEDTSRDYLSVTNKYNTFSSSKDPEYRTTMQWQTKLPFHYCL